MRLPSKLQQAYLEEQGRQLQLREQAPLYLEDQEQLMQKQVVPSSANLRPQQHRSVPPVFLAANQRKQQPPFLVANNPLLLGKLRFSVSHQQPNPHKLLAEAYLARLQQQEVSSEGSKLPQPSNLSRRSSLNFLSLKTRMFITYSKPSLTTNTSEHLTRK